MQSVSKRKNKLKLLKMPNLVLDSLQQNFFSYSYFEQPSRNAVPKTIVDQGLGSGINYWKQPACRVGRRGGGGEVSGQILISASFDLKI